MGWLLHAIQCLYNEETMPDLKILFEDNHIIAVEKPVNIPAQGDKTGDTDMLTLIKELIKERDKKPGNVYLGLVHRLDRPVGGVMVFAKTSKGASRLSDQIRRKTWKKSYLAVVNGNMETAEGELRHHLVKNEKLNMSRAVGPDHRNAKEAVLNYKVVGATEKFNLVRVVLQTGRHHQIRVQFCESGHPLYGDQKYGRGFSRSGQQIALWASDLVIEHPVTQKVLSFHSNPPDDYPWNLFHN
jgi:23S rRNA pseudouridine1911/1915/1917 synthase